MPMDYDEVERRRRKADPNTIPDAPSEERYRAQTKLPDLDPLKVPTASPAYAGGYNAQSAANQRVTSAEALAPRYLAQARSRQAVPDPYAGQLNRPGPPPSFASGGPTIEELQDWSRGSRVLPDGRVAPPGLALPPAEAETGGRDLRVVDEEALRRAGYDPSVTTPESEALQRVQRGGLRMTRERSNPVAGVDTPTGTAQEEERRIIKEEEDKSGVISEADKQRYRDTIGLAADEAAITAQRELQEEKRRQQMAMAQSAARRGVVGGRGNTRLLDAMVQQQVGERLREIQARRDAESAALERELKRADLNAKELEMRRIAAYQDFSRNQPKTGLAKFGDALLGLGASVATQGASNYLGQTGIFRPPATLPSENLGGSPMRLGEDPYYGREAMLRRLMGGGGYL